MAAVEDCAGAAGAPSTEAGLTSLDSDTDVDDMKNTARKSTTKLGALSEAKRAATPTLVANGNKVDLHSNKSVVNGDGPTKRPADGEVGADPAKMARLHLEEMANAQSEMTKKVNRDENPPETAGTVSNGKENTPLLNGKDSKDSLENSNDSNSKSSKGNSSLTITDSVKNNFKGILNVAVAKVESGASLEGVIAQSSTSSSPIVENEDKEMDSTKEGEKKSAKTNGEPEPEDVVVISSQDSLPDEEGEAKGENEEKVLEDQLLQGEDADSNADVDDAVLLSDDDDDDTDKKVEKEKKEKEDALLDSEPAVDCCEAKGDSDLKSKGSEDETIDKSDCADPAQPDEVSSSEKEEHKKTDIPSDIVIDLDDDDDEETDNKNDPESAPTTPIEIEDEDENPEETNSEKQTVEKESEKDKKADTDADSKSDVSLESQRKRPRSPLLSESSCDAKKSKLEKMEESEGEQSTKESKAADQSVVDVNLVDEKEEVKPEVKPECKMEVNAGSGKEQMITLSTEELNALLMKRMTSFIQKWRGSTIVQLQNRISELHSSVESWRAQAKRLAKQLDEEVAKNAQRKRNTGRLAKRGVNKEDNRVNQAAAVQHQQQQQQNQQQGKVMVRTPARSSPQLKSPPSMQVINNVRVNNQVRMTAAQAQAAQAKSATVRDLLDKQRGTDPVKKTVQIQGSRIVVPGSQVVARKSVSGAAMRQVQMQAAANGQSNKVIDLTDDDDRRSELVKSTSGRTVSTPTSTVQIRGSTAQNIRPGTQLLVQQNSSPQVLVASQAMRTAQGTLLYTTRPGSLMVQSAPGTSLVRPTNTATAPPALRPANLVTIARAPGVGNSTTTTVTPRPPPPLRSAPNTTVQILQARHPAPLPVVVDHQNISVANGKAPPPRPGLKISRVQSGIVLSWNMTITDSIASISNYQLFAYQETSAPPNTSLWKKVGDVKALPLPMACTLTQFQEGNKYHFAVRAVDVHGRLGPFSEPSTIALTVINVS